MNPIMSRRISTDDQHTISPDGSTLASSGASRQPIQLWDVDSGRSLGSWQGHQEQVSDIVFSRDGEVLISSSRDLTIRVWDAATGSALLSLVGHTRGVESVALSPDGALLASTSWDGTTRLWGIE